MSKTDGHCWYCGRPLVPFGDWEPDHQTPRCQGGRDAIENLVPACKPCNAAKGGRTVDEYKEKLIKKHAVTRALGVMWEVVSNRDTHIKDEKDSGIIHAAVWSLIRQVPTVTFFGEHTGQEEWRMYSASDESAEELLETLGPDHNPTADAERNDTVQ